jgi:alpha-glucuronidase
MKLEGYAPIDVTPWEDASAGKAISCPENQTTCTASTEFQGTAGWYKIDVQYFDTTPGVSRFRLYVGDQLIDTWSADADLPWKIPNGDTSTRQTVAFVALRAGDIIRIVGTPDNTDRAAIDYLEVVPSN